MTTFRQASWGEIQRLRARVTALEDASNLAEAAQRFVGIFADTFESVVLARVFMVAELGELPPTEREFAIAVANGAALDPKTRVLCLLGSRGVREAWNDRRLSQGHLAIPLVSADSVRRAPMIAQLLGDLNIDLRALDEGRPLAPRQLLMGRRGTFFVQDALTSTDADGRLIIATQTFAREFHVRSVFGMGGAYIDGTLISAIVFCSELLERAQVEPFASFIDTFKQVTSARVPGQLFPVASSS